MTTISSFIFMDLETTGLPWQENNMTRITELAMVSVHRNHILNSETNPPRVLQKLVLCFDPKKQICQPVCNITKLNNHLLSCLRPFDTKVMRLIQSFVETQIQPVCFVVHNGKRFDYPILRAEIDNIHELLPDNVLCIDSLQMFRAILKDKPEKPIVTVKDSGNSSSSDSFFNDDFVTEDDLVVITELERQFSDDSFDLLCESSIQNLITGNIITDAKEIKTVKNMNVKQKHKRRSYKLKDIYFDLIGTSPVDLHQAENDCMILLSCCMAKNVDFIEWSENNAMKFNDIPKMKAGRKFSHSFK